MLDELKDCKVQRRTAALACENEVARVDGLMRGTLWRCDQVKIAHKCIPNQRRKRVLWCQSVTHGEYTGTAVLRKLPCQRSRAWRS